MVAGEKTKVDVPRSVVVMDGRRAFLEEARSEWAVLGPLGRTILIALILSAVVAFVLAGVIPIQVERFLIDGEIRTIERIASDFADEGLIPPNMDSEAAMSTLDEAVRVRLLGSDIVRVKVWSADGTVTYSDVPDLIGRRYPLTPDRVEAFEGRATVEQADLTKPENEFEADFPPLQEFYVPVESGDGEVLAVFEVYHHLDHIGGTVDQIRSYVWLAVGVPIVLLGVFIAVLVLNSGRAITQRRKLAERLVGDLVRSQADERSRIIGSLHDDIGQSLYRIHYGLEDVKSKVGHSDPEVFDELDHLGGLVKTVDSVLRAELRLLEYGTGEELALEPALQELAEVTEMESDLDVRVEVGSGTELSLTRRIALFRAAREAVTNVRKHADATKIEIRVDHQGGTVRLRVDDDGIGVSDEPGLGLTKTRERLEALGGGLKVKSRYQGGSRFEAWVQTREAERAQ